MWEINENPGKYKSKNDDSDMLERVSMIVCLSIVKTDVALEFVKN